MTVFTPAAPPLGEPTTGLRLEEILLARNREHGVKVNILVNDRLLDPGLFDSLNSLNKYYDQAQEKSQNSVEVRGFPRAATTPMHAKIAVVDGKKAYVVGSPFVQGYFDAQTHTVDEPRRGVKSFFEHTSCAPIHDVSASIEGPAVEALSRSFLELWDHDGSLSAPAAVAQPAAGNTAVQIVRTLPGNLLPAVPRGETGILEAYLRAIREAEDTIFVDNQYFTDPLVGKALVRALNLHPNVQVIMVLNGRIDIPFYQSLQTRLILGMIDDLNPDAKPRFGVYTLWSHDAASAPQRIIRIYTHAKAGVVDDKWATVGSANLDGVSLHLSQHLIPPVSAQERLEKRNIEINALIFNEVDGLPASPVPGQLRRLLWAEYLGYGDADHPDLQSPPPGGWLELWRERAAAKLTGLKASPPAGHAALILEWRPEADPVKHLLALGLSRAQVLKSLRVQSEGRSFTFETGQWDE
jgi:phosphatidylserine/phosphatidylglycerophosphate/cardiolipin synthase-like enzyme